MFGAGEKKKAVILLGAIATALCSACGLGTEGPPADPSQESTESLTSSFKEAPHGPLPQVDFHGGAVVPNPRVITMERERPAGQHRGGR